MLKKFLKLFFSFILFIVLIFILIKGFKLDKFILKEMYPKLYSEYVEEASQKYNLDSNLIYAIIKNESNFDNLISSHKGAQGLMQLMSATAFEVAGKIGIVDVDLTNPQINIELGTKYYSVLYEKYGNYGLALAAYNAGSGNVDKWIKSGNLKADGSDIENIPFKETNMYVRKVLQAEKIYEYIYK